MRTTALPPPSAWMTRAASTPATTASISPTRTGSAAITLTPADLDRLAVAEGLQDPLFVIGGAGDEVGLELGRDLDVGMAEAVHPGDHRHVFDADVGDPDEGRQPDQQDQRQEQDREGAEVGAEIRRLADQGERDHRRRDNRQQHSCPR